ncbi:unnamed protein product [Ixodes persulcatus]
MNHLRRVAGVVQQAGCPFSSQRHLHSRRATKEAAENAEVARLFEETTRELMRSVDGGLVEARQDAVDLQDVSIDGTALAATCPPLNVKCNASKRYREPDGTCNNMQNPGWGSAGSCMSRLQKPAYQDGISKPRVAQSGGPLPNARLISYTVHPDMDMPATSFTHMVMQIGQFIDHDIALAPLEPNPGEIVNLGNPNNPIDCCSASTRNTSECFSIDIPTADPFFAPLHQTCMNLPRSAPCSRCNLGKDQQDILTSYIDGSQIYGSSAADTQRLRTLTQGLLKYQVVNGKELLPRSFHPTTDRCSNPSQNQYCFRAGDERANEHPGLTSIHTVWLRQHNLLADTFRGFNPNLSDETLFQTSKRIVESQFAHIVYKEWLPIVLGPGLMSQYQLTPKTSGFTTYDKTVDATMLNEFAAAAFRLGHTLIQGTFFLVNSNGDQGSFELEENYFFPFNFYNGDLDYVLRGLLQQKAQEFDKFVTDGVTHHLYRLRNDTFGLDLIALNIQRAREHGIRPYVDYLNSCKKVQIKSFDDLLTYIPKDVVDKYKTIYKDVRDIDLFTAGISEKRVSGGIVGPTFGCILGTMFQRFKLGDRFYYEHEKQAGSFTSTQLNEIRKTTFSRILCDNSDAISSIQKNAFVPSGSSNSVTNCQQIPQTDLRAWL